MERCAKSSHTCLRTGRALSRPKTYVKGNRIGAGKIKDMVMISERSAVAMRWTPKSAEAMLKMSACTYAAISTASGPITSNKISYGSTKEVAARDVLENWPHPTNLGDEGWGIPKVLTRSRVGS